MNMQLGIYW